MIRGILRTVSALALGLAPLPAQQAYTSEQMDEGGRIYRANCAQCHGPEGAAIDDIDFSRGRFKRVVSDQELRSAITGGVPGTAMPPTALSNPEAAAVVAYLRSMPAARAAAAAVTGDPKRGQVIFENAGGCLSCHRVQQRGSHLGPDLTEIGAMRQAPDLERSILDPGATVLAQHRFIEALKNDGVKVSGRRLHEDTLAILIIDSNERLTSLSKADLKEYRILKTTIMPSLRGKLKPQELVDLVSYLASLKGVNP